MAFPLGPLTHQPLAVISRTTSFNVQIFYTVLTSSLTVPYGLLHCTALTDRICITEVESVYSAVRTEPYRKQIRFLFKGLTSKLTVNRVLANFQSGTPCTHMRSRNLSVKR